MTTELASVSPEEAVKLSLRSYAQTLTNLPDQQVTEALAFLRKLEEMAEQVKKTLTARVIKKVQADTDAQQVSEAGTFETNVDGQTWRIIPTGKTRPEVNKVAALLMAKGHHDVNRFFTQETDTVCTKQDLDIIVNTLGLLTPEEAATCLPKRSFRVEIKEAREVKANY